ncbi:Hypothetical predicted protein [Mytilus galloprovincialis]|uniref:Roc domain-containing protein n=1 Tax=Mytilus galloprovincialis TaxID=29158 RepID=A0A8B6C1E1_MYTGA|nr:Hypothetical predicted protein [Mytilus galloprovincialis]
MTVEWYIETSHTSMTFVLNHRQNGSAQWNMLTLFTDDIEVEHNGRCLFQLTKLAPVTWYELQLCYSDNHFNRIYTETKTLQTKATDLSAFYNQLPDADKTRYTNMMQSTEMEERYFVKIMIVGKEEAGKTCLLKRLLNEDKKRLVDVITTDGVNIVRRCKINIEDGKWTTEKDDIIDDKADRIQRAENKSMKHDVEELNDAVHKTEIGKSKNETEMNSKGTSNKPPHKSVNGSKASCTSTSYQESREQKPESGSQNQNNEGKSSPLTNYPTTPRFDEVNAFKKEKTDDNSPLKTKQENSKKQENSYNRDVDNNRKMKYNEDTLDTKESLKPKQEQNEPLLKMPDDLMSHVFSTSPTSNSSSERYAVCALWDFAGQKEFYATHQAFLTSNAIYLVVADMDKDIFQQDVKQYFAEFQNVGGIYLIF